MNETQNETPILGDERHLIILKHRDAHFGGSFPLMIDYYQKGGRGVSAEFEIEDILALAEAERLGGKNLSDLVYSDLDRDEVARASDAYQKLRDLYKVKSPKNPFPNLIADLILTEEADPVEAVAAIVAQKSAIVPHLIDLLKSDDLYNPLFPGYGEAPYLAARCLGEIGDKRAIIALFESIGKGDFFDDDIALKALYAIGQPAKDFLLRILPSKPINEDNERAAIALLSFKDQPDVASAYFHFLQTLPLPQHLPIATYLILGCEGLYNTPEQSAFEKFARSSTIPKELKYDFNSILDGWKART